MVESIYSKNLPPHENPIPHASKINGLIMEKKNLTLMILTVF